MARGADEVVCVSAATGKEVWSLKSPATDVKPRGSVPDHARGQSLVTDGRAVYFKQAGGLVVATDLAGGKLWSIDSKLINGGLTLHDGRLIVRGAVAADWPIPESIRKRIGPDPAPTRKVRPRDYAAVTGVLVLSAADGSEASRRSFAGDHAGRGEIIHPRGTAEPLYILGARFALSTRDFRKLFAIDTVLPGQWKTAYSRDRLVYTSCGRSVAVGFYTQADGRAAYRTTWETNEVSRGDVGASSAICDGRLYTWHNVPEWGPHCPDTRAYVTVYRAETGEVLERVKPVMLNSREPYGGLIYATPAFAGKYVYLVSPTGPDRKGQVSILTAGDDSFLVKTNLVEGGTRARPIFVGNRMILRSPTSLTCIAVTDQAGRAWQARQVARSLFEQLGPNPGEAQPSALTPADGLSADMSVPLAKLEDDLPSTAWLAAGPFPRKAHESELASLRPREGTKLTVGGTTCAFASVDRRHAYRHPPRYARHASLQGTGDIVPTFDACLDPRGWSGKGTTGVFYTVLENNTERMITSGWASKGLTAWLGGTKIERNTLYLLPTGLYPFVVQVDGTHYDRQVDPAMERVDVSKALAAKALQPVGWPKTWKVVGAIPPDLQPLEGEVLADVPAGTMTVGRRDYTVHELPAADGRVYLTCLIGLQPGMKPIPITTPPPMKKVPIPHQAYCFAEVDLPSDGTLYVNAGADWYMRWYVDGKVVLDTLKSGNGAPPMQIAGHALELKLAGGKHTLAVLVRPGSRGWSFGSAGGFHTGDKAALMPYRLAGKVEKKVIDYRVRPGLRVHLSWLAVQVESNDASLC